MFIKEIVLDGFKCYEEKTVLANLDRTFNAITGMNGSGKSNILDGILFVLGLEGTKVLRANNMKELVNIHRKECRVTLVICNREKRKSPPGYEHCDEIHVSRAVDVEGRSRYYLNGHLCTLSTLNKLCVSMGISPSRGSFSFVVMQGHITKVLSIKSRELKSLIEETAGTRPYEREKERAAVALEKKEIKLREAKETLEKRISPFYGRLREERVAFLEFRSVEEMKTQLLGRKSEIERAILSNEICSEIKALRGCIEHYLQDMASLDGIERKMREAEEMGGEYDAVWLRASVDEENLKLEEIRSRGLEDVLKRKVEELKSIGECGPKYEMDVLVERERLLLQDLGESGYGEDSTLKKFEELTALRFQRSKVEFQLNAIGSEEFSQERLDGIERLRVDKDELEGRRKRLRVLRSKINYPFVADVFGTVEENIEVLDMKYQEAIYTVLGAKAKYVITSDEKVGGALLKSADRSISIIPLSKIRTCSPSPEVTREIRSRGGINMIDLVRFDARVRKAIEFVFNGFFVFEDKRKARDVCFEHKVTCVTVDGTVYDPRGTLTGGRSSLKIDVVRRRDIEDLEKKIGQMEANLREFDAVHDEYVMLVRRKGLYESRKRLESEIQSMDGRISLLSELCENKVDARKELRAVREKIVESAREARELKLARERRDVLRREIEGIQDAMRSSGEEERACMERIVSYQKMLNECSFQNDARRMSEREVEGLEPRQKYLIKSTTRLQSKIARIYSGIERKMGLLVEHGEREEELFDDSVVLEEELVRSLQQLKIDPKHLCFRTPSDMSSEVLTVELDRVNSGLERCNTVKKTTMEPSNFDLLEKNEMAIAELKEKIEKLERDRQAITQSISRLDDLGVRENEKAFEHINTRLGRLLQYFIADSDARICNTDGEYVLRVKVGNWKESLDELSGGQRSIVALCLIFSMLTYKPAPFYIFDEIDSALDLSYTQSIGEIIRREFDSAQFIVVSLKNGMFDNASSVFKVFIQDGKSKICQIK